MNHYDTDLWGACNIFSTYTYIPADPANDVQEECEVNMQKINDNGDNYLDPIIDKTLPRERCCAEGIRIFNETNVTGYDIGETLMTASLHNRTLLDACTLDYIFTYVDDPEEICSLNITVYEPMPTPSVDYTTLRSELIGYYNFEPIEFCCLAKDRINPFDPTNQSEWWEDETLKAACPQEFDETNAPFLDPACKADIEGMSPGFGEEVGPVILEGASEGVEELDIFVFDL